MNRLGVMKCSSLCLRSLTAKVLLIAVMGLLALPSQFAAQTTKAKTAPATKTAPTTAAKTTPAKGTPTSTAHAAPGAGGTKTGPGAGHQSTVTHNAGGGTTVHTRSGAEVTKSPSGRVTSVRTANGHEARFGANGRVREVHANGMVVSHGPGGMRRTVYERPDHSRLVAEGHGRGYIQRPYSYGGHAYYHRAYYYHGGYRNAYYRGYYYNGVYLNGYMPAYYYPAAYYGWAYNPWPAPVAYGWGWGGNPWYGYYGAYFAPYPVYPSAAYWLTDYMVAASLANAYAALSVSARLHPEGTKPRLVYASYDPATGTTSPTMTKEVKDAVSQEVSRELAAQKTQGQADNNVASLGTLLGDGQPHVFVASAGLTVTSAGQECGLTDGDVLALNTKPAADATGADLKVLASKEADCGKGSVVTVEMTDLQEMHNHLLASIDQGMAEMKDHPGQGGLPSPPAEAIQGTKQAPYAAAAPAADPNGAAELDQQAQQGAEVEQQVVAEATAADAPDGTAPAETAEAAPAAPAAAPARHTGPITIALGQTTDQVIANKGQPTSKVNFPNKMMYIYPDMKITFVGGKVSDVQ